MFNSKLREIAVENYKKSVERYDKAVSACQDNCESLYKLRLKSVDLIREMERYINSLSVSEKHFQKELQEISLQLDDFQKKQNEITESTNQAKIGGGVSAGASVGASLGIAVATLAPTAAMGVATTFGVASTGTAIASLSGAAADSAALAWLGGGALAAGGGGTAAGGALLTLAGPVGWTIAAVGAAVAGVTGVISTNKNREVAEQAQREQLGVQRMIQDLNLMNNKIQGIIDVNLKQNAGIKALRTELPDVIYKDFSEEEKTKVGMLVNQLLALSKLLNKEVK